MSEASDTYALIRENMKAIQSMKAMKTVKSTFLLTVLFMILLGCILTNSKLSLSYAAMGLNLWFEKMIPSLLPFMILSGIMVRLKLTDKFSMILYPLVKPLFKVRKNVCYAMIIGFLCGFPMGARVVDDLYMRRMIDKREAQYLLSFCNNIGPVYFCSFVLPLLERKRILPYLFGMYGIPFLYGWMLRYTRYRDLPAPSLEGSHREEKRADLVSCENAEKKSSLAERLLEAADDSVHSSMQNILSLGGYMILFNLLNLFPHVLLGKPPRILSPLLEITGGLTLLENALPLYSLLALSFGGLSCIAQTYGSIADSDLSIKNYVLHKIALTLLNGLFYLSWFLLQPSSFMA